MINEIKLLIVRHVENMLNTNNFKYFIGGSQYFGYAKETSDYDVFVGNNDPNALRKYVLKMGFSVEQTESYPGIVYEFKINGQNMVHIIEVPHEQFNIIQREHEEIKKIITADIIRVCRYLKDIEKLSGAKVFKMLNFFK
jgi:hypothetical protein